MEQFTEWLVEDRVIGARYGGTLTLETIQTSIEILIDLMNSSEAPLVHILVNAAEVTKYPMQLPQIIPVTQKLYTYPQLGWMIVYGQDDRIIQFLTATTTSMFNVRYRSFSTRDEAVAFLNSVDETLPDLNAGESTATI